MHIAFEVSRFLSMAAFFAYGLACVWGQSMVAEFERFGLANMRVLIGSLEVLGALGLLVGYVFPPLVVVSAGGLSLLMVLGIIARVRVHDPLLAMLPALVLLLINVFVLVHATQRLSQR